MLGKIKNYPQYITKETPIAAIQLSNFQINAGMNLAAYIAKEYLAPILLQDI